MAQTAKPPAPSPRGLADVVAASTAISDIDGRAGLLSQRGFDIHDLAGEISFEECVHLLQRGPRATSPTSTRVRRQARQQVVALRDRCSQLVE